MKTPSLSGSLVQLWPYSPKVHRQDILIKLCDAITASRMAHKVFWAYAREENQDTIDVAFFLNYMQKVILLLVQDLETGGLVGACWFDEVFPTHRANFNIWYERKAWGKQSIEATEIAARYGFETFELNTLWGFTPWRLALRHGLKLGWKHIATLPRYACIRAEPHDLYILLKEKDR